MAKEVDFSKGFLIKGAVPLEPPARMIDFIEESRKAEVLGIVDALEKDNTAVFDEDVRDVLAPIEQKLYGTACIRYQNGEFNTVKRLRGKKASSWTIDDPSEPFKNFHIDFRTKRGRVAEVERFRTGGMNSVEMVLQNGSITTLDYDCAPWFAGQQSASYPQIREWVLWFEDTSRELNKEHSRISSRNDRKGITFDIPGRSLEVYTTTGSGSRWTWKRKYIFNALENRFNEQGDNVMRLSFMKESLRPETGKQITDEVVREYAGISKYNRHPIVDPEEFLIGLELLLDTIPLD
jgi:hypothetical protein